MKITNRILVILTLVFHSYFPISVLIAKASGMGVSVSLPIIPAIITAALTVAATVFAFLYSTPAALEKAISVLLAPITAVNFAIYFIYTSSTAAIVLIMISFASIAVILVKQNKSLVMRVLTPIIMAAIGIFTFAFSLVLAIVIGISTRPVETALVSPDGELRAELYKKSSSSYEVRLITVDDEANLPFLTLTPRGETVWSGKWEESFTMEWQDADTLTFGGTVIEVEQFFD